MIILDKSFSCQGCFSFFLYDRSTSSIKKLLPCMMHAWTTFLLSSLCTSLFSIELQLHSMNMSISFFAWFMLLRVVDLALFSPIFLARLNPHTISIFCTNITFLDVQFLASLLLHWFSSHTYN